MHHPAHTPTGPADLALPLGPVRQIKAAHGPRRAPELRTATGRGRRAARRRSAAAVQG
ncbi:hypothetical protein OH786_15675 [Streptomyces atratus]|uniref:Uncharacterized protein n=1 Tax=Streptomyces atratus TaxID=1893 RepID=A0A1K2ENR5_STRAR|nr:hypothetical protein [Streptomyces atratus]SFY36520.1 hypothetical protein SAMN02787144_1020120 [Streptomyces atratus]